MPDFEDLPPAAQQLVREKQKQKQARKAAARKTRKKGGVVKGAAGELRDLAELRSFPTRMSMDAYFDSCPFGSFRDPSIEATEEHVALVMKLVDDDAVIGYIEQEQAQAHEPQQARPPRPPPTPVTLAKFCYFHFRGTDTALWDGTLYARLAYEGFFTITHGAGRAAGHERPLPELQPHYSVVLWPLFREAKQVRRTLAALRRRAAARAGQWGGAGGEKSGATAAGGGGSSPTVPPSPGPVYELVNARDPEAAWRAIDSYQREHNGSNWLTRRYLRTMQAASADAAV
eukprot:g2541.t1